MSSILLVGLGGALGSMARYKLSGWVLHHTVSWKFPVGTLAVNVLGCLAAGIVAGLVAKQDLFSPQLRVFLLAGVLGGFTTFSAFGLETVLLMKRGHFAVAAANVIVSVVAGLLVLWLGFGLTTARAAA